MAKDSGNVIGIDLGTTFSAMARLDRRGACITIPNAEGELTTPSVVLFEPGGNVVVGRRALRACKVCPDRVAFCVKRDIGEAFCEHPIAGRRTSPVHISSLILKKLKQDAEQKIGPVAGAVIAVPAYFDEVRRQATVDAGSIAGLNVLDILNEPTAAALAYGFKDYLDAGGDVGNVGGAVKTADTVRNVVVYDLGGGTFDVTVIRIEGEQFRVLATEGEVRLGGEDWDERVLSHAAGLLQAEHGVDPRQDPHSHQELLLAVEEAKRDLSQRDSTEFTVHCGGQRAVVKLTRGQFEDMTSALLYRTESRVCQVIENAKLTWEDVDTILLVGGSTRMPQVPAMLRRVTGQEPDGSLSADEVVAHGAAIQAAMIVVTGKPAEQTVDPDAVADESKDASDADVLIRPPSAHPVTGEVSGVEGGSKPLDVSTDDFVSIGFDYDDQIATALSEVTTVNVNAHSLGVVARSAKTGKNITSVMIPRNSALPASYKKIFGVVTNNQQSVIVQVLEGESEDPEACVQIGECVVAPLAPGLKRGSPISVTFTYDNSGRLHVEARDETSGTAAETVIIRESALTQKEMVKAQKVIASLLVS